MAARVAGCRGAVLVITLVMLFVLALSGAAAFMLTVDANRISGNSQIRMQLEAEAQRAVETVLSSTQPFDSPTAPVTFAARGGFDVAVSDRTCLVAVAAEEYSALLVNYLPQNTVWRFSVTATDRRSGAAVTIEQGVAMSMPTGACP